MSNNAGLPKVFIQCTKVVKKTTFKSKWLPIQAQNELDYSDYLVTTLNIVNMSTFCFQCLHIHYPDDSRVVKEQADEELGHRIWHNFSLVFPVYFA